MFGKIGIPEIAIVLAIGFVLTYFVRWIVPPGFSRTATRVAYVLFALLFVAWAWGQLAPVVPGP